MSRCLDLIQDVLKANARTAGFEPTEMVRWADLEWLEYRKVDQAGTMLLSIFHQVPACEFIAELWRPDGLTVARRSVTMECMADRRMTWSYSRESDADDVARNFAEVTGDWLAKAPRGSIR